MFKIYLSTLLFLISAHAYAWDLGDSAYIYDGADGSQKYFASVEIEDIRGEKVRVRVKGHCFRSGGQGIGCWSISFSENNLKVGDLKWVDKSTLTDSYRDKL
jgi:hypothetical protein